MDKAKWPINLEKAVLDPTEELTFLGATWRSDRTVRRSSVIDKVLQLLVRYVVSGENLPPRLVQQIRGYMLYYGGFAGQCYAIVTGWLKMPLWKRRLYQPLVSRLLMINVTRFRLPSKAQYTVQTDASEEGLAFIVVDPRGKLTVVQGPSPENLNILVLEMIAAVEALEFIVRGGAKIDSVVDLHTDNMATLWFIRRGACRWATVPFDVRAELVIRLMVCKQQLVVRSHYIASERNPVDYFSRHDSSNRPYL